MDNLQSITKASQYRQRYLALLKRPNISKADAREFRKAVEHYKTVFPDWREFNIN